MKSGKIAAIVLLFCFSTCALYAVQQPAKFHASLARKYGRAMYQECRLDIDISSGSGAAALSCAPHAVPKPGAQAKSPLLVQKALSTAEVQSLSDLLSQRTLFEGAMGSGTDSTPVDGIFETLEMRSGSKVAVAVTSGNSTFVESAQRKQLLDLMKAIEQRLSSGQ